MAPSVYCRHSQQRYNRRTDVLVVSLKDAEETITVDTPLGFVIHYSVPEHEPVAVTVWEYCSRFGGRGRTLHIDADEPFDVTVGDLPECAAAPRSVKPQPTTLAAD